MLESATAPGAKANNGVESRVRNIAHADGLLPDPGASNANSEANIRGRLAIITTKATTANKADAILNAIPA